MQHDPRVDAYISRAAEFAGPILAHLRGVVHQALPDAEESIKWGMPHFLIGGKNVAGMAAFKAHCTFIVHGEGRQGEAMGQFGRICSLADLPSEAELATRLQAARERVRTKGTAQRTGSERGVRPEIPVPEDLAAALADVPPAQEAFGKFAPSHRRDYLEWIAEAKTKATREKRIAQAVGWIAEGKHRHWKYERR